MRTPSIFSCQASPCRLIWACLSLVLWLALSALAAPDAGQSQELYRLRPGDEISVTVTPQKTYDCKGLILPDGMVHLRNIGAIKATGLTLLELQEQVRKALSEKLVSPKVSVSLTSIATTAPSKGTITVTGAVSNTGPMRLEGELRLHKALELAGGTLRNADLTQISILHKDLSRSVVDLSTPERISDPRNNLLLQDGDSVEVRSRPNRTVSIHGAVTAPENIELTVGLRLWTALHLVGGAKRDADLTKITVIHKDLTRTVVDLSTLERVSDPKQNILLQEGDLVEVPSLLEGVSRPEGTSPLEMPSSPDTDANVPQVRIRGHVLNPGPYPYKAGMELVDLIEAAGKLTPTANPAQIQIKRSEEPIQTVDLLKQNELGFKGAVLLRPGDDVFVPDHANTVLLIGAVPKYGPMPVSPGQTLSSFFMESSGDAAGALNPAQANLKNVQIIRRNQEPMKINLKELVFERGRNKSVRDVVLQPGDVIFVPPREPRRGPGLLTYLSQLGPLAYLFAF